MSEAPPPITEGELRRILLFFLAETHERLDNLAAQPWDPEIQEKLAALGEQVLALTQELATSRRSRRSSRPGT